MTISKMINPGHIKGMRLPPDEEEEKKLPEWNKKLQKVVSKIERFCYKYKIPFLQYSKALDDLAMFPLKMALEFIWDRFVRTITFRHFRQQLGSGWAYFKKGYRAYDFDSCYAMEMFLWKLERLADVMYDNDRHFGDKENAERIREVIRLINRVIEDDYHDEFETKVAEKYGDNIRYVAKADGLFGSLNKGKGPFKNKHCGAVTMYRREKWTPELDKEINKAERASYRKAHNKRMREWKKALSIIEKHFFEWWD
jgi:hypothetical protein